MNLKRIVRVAEICVPTTTSCRFSAGIALAVTALLVPFQAERASAQSIAIPTNFTTAPLTLSEGDVVQMSATGNRSYCLEITKLELGGATAVIDAIETNGVGVTVVAKDRGQAYPVVRPGGGLNDKRRTCFRLEGLVPTIPNFIAFAQIDTSNNGAVTGQIVRFSETTLFGGYNTSVTDFNFLELTNLSSANDADNGQISGTVIITDAITDELKLTQPFTVNPSDRVDINIHDSVGSGSFGTVVVVHDGVPGSLAGVVSQYRIVTTVPFDFEPVAQSILTTSLER